MMQINDILSTLYGILKCRIALSVGSDLYLYPKQEGDLDHQRTALLGYRKLDIDAAGSSGAFYVDEHADINDVSLKLAALFISTELRRDGDLSQCIIRLLDSNYTYSDIAAISSIVEKAQQLHLIVIQGADLSENRIELNEIVNSSFEVKLWTEYQDNLVAAVEEQEINDACGTLQKNIMTELFLECTVAIGGVLHSPQQLPLLYNSCLEALELKRRFNIKQNVLDYEAMAVYKLVASMDGSLKKSIRERTFTGSFLDMLNNEIEITIDEMFKNNLNLTDTAARLYIHRNTLLYRIEKIYKHTGFDLRKFEDSMIFKLAWLMHKEKQI